MIFKCNNGYLFFYHNWKSWLKWKCYRMYICNSFNIWLFCIQIKSWKVCEDGTLASQILHEPACTCAKTRYASSHYKVHNYIFLCKMQFLIEYTKTPTNQNLTQKFTRFRNGVKTVIRQIKIKELFSFGSLSLKLTYTFECILYDGHWSDPHYI